MAADASIEMESDLPGGISKPARRALIGAGYGRLELLAKASEQEVLKLHGMGPKAMDPLRSALMAKGLSFAAGEAKPKRQPVRPQVEEFMNKLEHPLKKEIEEVRHIILASSKELTEHIKWNAPSYCIHNEDRVTFNLHGKGFFRLIFHCGPKVREGTGKEPLFDDATGLLEWLDRDRAFIPFTDMQDVRAKKEKLEQVLAKWIEVTAS
ncbi:DUF1801 domain-containing protein [Paenibacillus nasutitermitis]|uniref:YdhG-like domain-containing protein n=1 Tax=Paenibacillus nasutitermitis TaxID=1652958 RepID=A0A916ZAS0_9BACL|nr:DUF1801 domain-containing protein [Paenibacillus nasutitermitis]GGD84729.1 hypothetical protein GCM10010911_48890 [Paenibacillus nasutitermitis]